MARSKAVFSGREPTMGQVSHRTRQMLREIAGRLERTERMRAQGWPDPEEEFVGAVVAEADILRVEHGYIWNAKRDPLAPAKKEARETCVALRRSLERVSRDLHAPPVRKRFQRTLKAAESNLRLLPVNVDRELGVDADPLSVADDIRELLLSLATDEKPRSTVALSSKIDSLLVQINAAQGRIALWPPTQSWKSLLRAACVEASLRVLRVLREWEVPTSAHATDALDPGGDERVSVAVRVMLSIAGDFTALPRGRDAWRRIVGEALQRDGVFRNAGGRQKRGPRRS